MDLIDCNEKTVYKYYVLFMEGKILIFLNLI